MHEILELVVLFSHSPMACEKFPIALDAGEVLPWGGGIDSAKSVHMQHTNSRSSEAWIETPFKLMNPDFAGAANTTEAKCSSETRRRQERVLL